MSLSINPALPQPPPAPPVNPDASDLTVLANSLSQWQAYQQALQSTLDALQTDKNYVSLTATIVRAANLGSSGGFHGWYDGSGTPWYAADSNQEWLTANQQISTQNQLISEIQGELTSAQGTVNTIQQQYSQFANTDAGGQEENTLLQNAKTGTTQAQTALAAQVAQTAAATASAKTKMIIIVTVVILVAVVVIYLGIRYFKKKNKEEKTK